MTMHTLAGLAAETERLRGLARALVRDADDLVQEAYVVGAARAPADRPLGPWLVRVTRNLARMRARAAHRREAREREVGLRASPPATPAELVERVELHHLLAGLVLQLPAPARDVLLLRYFEELSFAAIARRLAMPEATVRWRHAEALRQLRAQLEQRNRAWLPALAAFAGRRPPLVAGAAAGLVAAALVTVAFVAWAVFQLLPATHAVASAPLPHPAAKVVAAAAPKARPVPSLAPPTLGMLMGEQLRVDGVVVDVAGNGVAGAELSYLCGGRFPTVEHARSGAGGAFSFEIERDCMLQLTARIDERVGHHGSHPGERTSDAPIALTVTLSPLHYLVVHVVDADTRAPIAGASVRVLRGGASDGDVATSDARGAARVAYEETRAVLRDLPELRAIAPDHAPVRVHLSDAFDDHDQPRALTIALPRGYLARGTVFGPGGVPVPGATIEVDERAERPADNLDGARPMLASRADILAGADGRFEVRFARPGRYVLSPRSPTMITPGRQTAVTVGPGGDAEVDLHMELRENVGLAGIVLGPDGAPFVGARIISPYAGLPTAITDAEGRFAISDWRPEYTIYARAGSFASEPVDVTLAPEDKQRRVTLRLAPSGIAGTAVDREGTPVAGAELWIPNLPREAGRHITTDADGHFAIDVPAGTYRLSIRRSSDDDYLDEDDVLVPAGTHDLRIVVP